jgi:dihydroceramidase
MASFLSVNTRTQNVTGWWGPADANHQFCEPHYAVSDYIAEWNNTWSSLLYTFTAIYLWRHIAFKTNDVLVKTIIVWLGLIGLGSFGFHGTMLYPMQLCDEIPMVGLIATAICAKISRPGLHPYFSTARKRQAGMITATLASCGLVFVYVVLGDYEIFIHGFTALALVDTVLSATLNSATNSNYQAMLWCRNAAVIFILVGRVVWETENRACHVLPQVWPLHVAWHVLSCLTSYYGILFDWLVRLEGEEQANADLSWCMGLPRRFRYKQQNDVVKKKAL